MSVAVRVIPCLDVSEGRVVKGVNFVDLVDAGDPVELARRYDEEGADELTFLDITATSDNRRSAYEMIRRTAEQVFIPLTVGGGVRTTDDIDALLRAGADKVSINSAAVARPEFLSEAANRFGSQCVVIAIDARRVQRRAAGRPARPASRSPPTAAGGAPGSTPSPGRERAEAAGAGEILLTSMDADGTKDGFDTDDARRDPGRGRGAADRVRRRRRARPLPRGGRGRRGRRAGGVGVPLRAAADRAVKSELAAAGYPVRAGADRGSADDRRDRRDVETRPAGPAVQRRRAWSARWSSSTTPARC